MKHTSPPQKKQPPPPDPAVNKPFDCVETMLNSESPFPVLPGDGQHSTSNMTPETVISGAWKNLAREIETWANEQEAEILVKRQMRMLVCRGSLDALAKLKEWLASPSGHSPFESAIFPPLDEGGKRQMLRGNALAKEKQIVKKLPCLAATPSKMTA